MKATDSIHRQDKQATKATTTGPAGKSSRTSAGKSARRLAAVLLLMPAAWAVGGRTGVTAISAGEFHSLALKNGRVIAWGDNEDGQTNVPPAAATGVTAISAGESHNLALKNGRVIAWGSNIDFLGNYAGQTDVPAKATNGVTAISAGGRHSLALKNGRVIAWGYNEDGQTNVPTAARSGVVAIAAGRYHSLALKNGRVIAWGDSGCLFGYDSSCRGVTDVPTVVTNGVTAIAAGELHNLALKNGRIIEWDLWGIDGPYSMVPTEARSGVNAIAASSQDHNLALKDGRVIAWGGGSFYGQTNVPMAARSGVVAIAAGFYHSLALKRDGTVVAWGYNGEGQADVPAAFRAADAPSLSITPGAAGQMEVSWPTETGSTNRLQSAADLAGEWNSLGPAVAGDGSFHTVTVPAGGAAAFYRLVQ